MNIKSVEIILLTFGFWHWDLNARMPLRLSCDPAQFASLFRDEIFLGDAGRSLFELLK